MSKTVNNHPDWYRPLYDPDITKEVYGAKAYGLSMLKKVGVRTPGGVAIPCHYSIKPPKEIPESVIQEWTWLYFGSSRVAVRSGAPVSMPGLLDTKLNVFGTREELTQAIRQVWDSWWVEKAVEYRKARQISDDIGTGVVIQKMLKPLASGVAFTADPNDIKHKSLFNPQLEWVTGTGDKLVGGEVKPFKGDLTGKAFEGAFAGTALSSKILYTLPARRLELANNLKSIHSTFGPSDVEWVLTKEGISFVQWRPLKFIQDVEDKPVQMGDKITQGVQIGQPVTVTGKLVMNPDRFKPGDILYASMFTPDITRLMLEAKAILCTVGGQLCHAAIIARDTGKPAISELQLAKLFDFDKQIITVTADGAIHLADTSKAEVIMAIAQELAPVKAVKPEVKLNPDRLPDARYWNINHAISATGLVVRFYQNYQWLLEGKITEERFQKVCSEMARILNSYFWLASVGECRHVARKNCNSHYWSPGFNLHDALTRFSELGVQMPAFDSKPPQRVDFVKNCVKAPTSIEQAYEIIGLVIDCFEKCIWEGGGFGGHKWGNIAICVQEYLDGRLTDKMFCDAVFNLEHNGGSAFNKFRWLISDSQNLQGQLNSRRIGNDIHDLLVVTRPDDKIYTDLDVLYDFDQKIFYASMRKCHICDKTIYEENFEYHHGNSIHKECRPQYNTLVCVICKESLHCVDCAVKDGDDKFYHDSCMNQSCTSCGVRVLRHDIKTFNDWVLCPPCYGYALLDENKKAAQKKKLEEENAKKKVVPAKTATSYTTTTSTKIGGNFDWSLIDPTNYTVGVDKGFVESINEERKKEVVENGSASTL
jgi:pyruvate, water dikinase